MDKAVKPAALYAAEIWGENANRTRRRQTNKDRRQWRTERAVAGGMGRGQRRKTDNLTNKATQLATGHGNMKQYLRRFGLRETDGRCDCGADEMEDVRHVMFSCTRQERINVRRRLLDIYGDLDIKLRVDGKNNQEHAQKLNEWAESAIASVEARYEGNTQAGEAKDKISRNNTTQNNIRYYT